jgi:hypothetical protein
MNSYYTFITDMKILYTHLCSIIMPVFYHTLALSMGIQVSLCLGQSEQQWVENNPTYIHIFPTNICIFCLMVLC